MSPTQTLSPSKTPDSIELTSLPVQASISHAGTMNTMLSTSTSINANDNRAERAMGASTSSLTEFPDPLGLRARIFTPKDEDDKGS